MTGFRNLGYDSVTSATLFKLMNMAANRDQNYLAEFQKYFLNFYAKISGAENRLTNQELLLCALLKLGFSREAIIEMGYKPGLKSLSNSMYIIGHKLPKPQNQHLRTFLESL
jgi:hypothetical protein